VESAWRRAEELAGPVRRSPEPGLDAAARLRALARSIPEGWPGAAAIAQQILALRGDAAAIESALIALDDSLLEQAATRLDAAEAAALEGWVQRRLEPLRARFDEAELIRAAARLRSRELRKRAGLPLLSLFSTDAEAQESAE
jgi:hypothetical protein